MSKSTGPGSRAQPMALAIPCLMMCHAIATSVVHAVPFTRGCYVYEAPPVEEGSGQDGTPKPISFDAGRLTDGDADRHGESVTWTRRPGGGMSVVFDLLRDCSPNRVTVVVGRNPKSWHSMACVARGCRRP